MFPKPNLLNGSGWNSVAAKLCQTVRLLSRVRVVSRRPRKSVSSLMPAHDRPRLLPSWVPEVIAIGASTGGPAVIRQILEVLPADYPIPIIIVQHIGEEFVPGLVQWLDHNAAIRVSLAQDRQAVMPGTAVVAPGNVHLRMVEGPAIKLDNGPLVQHCRPAADVLFHSAAQVFHSKVVGILLTGMGRDGADGLRAIHSAGGLTIAQDKDSSTVYGMPGTAVELGVVQYVMAPQSIGRWLVNLPKSATEVQ